MSRLVLLVIVFVLGASSPAFAGTLTRVDQGDGTSRLEYRDTSPLVVNSLDVLHIAGDDHPLQFSDGVMNTTSLPAGCIQLNSGHVAGCVDDVARIDIFLGPGDDKVHFDHLGAEVDRVDIPARIFGEAGNDCLEGTDQDDVIDGGTPATGETGTGNDRIFGSAGTDAIRGEDGNDVLNGFWDALPPSGGGCSFRETPLTADSDDVIDGGPGNDTILGGAGPDVITDFSGPNTLGGGIAGGDGNDTIRTSAAFVDVVDGGAGADNITGSFQAAPNPVNGDDLRGGAGADAITGGPANERLDGGADADTLVGEAGSDTLVGGAAGDAANTLVPGLGRDTVDGGGSAGDVVRYTDATRTEPVTVTLGAAGNGSAEDGAGDVLSNVEGVIGTPFADRLTGDARANPLQGGAGDDTISGGAGDDTLSGGDGDDVQDGGAGSDSILGGSGTDTVDYSSRTAPVSVTLNSVGRGRDDGSPADDGTLDDVDATEVVLGGAGGDRLTADPATGSRLLGDGGADVLTGGAGPDTFDGGPGADSMDGQAGTDLVTYASAAGPVSVTLNDGTANDGAAGEGDQAEEIENVTGGPGADALTGDGGANALEGGAGDDVLRGLLGADTLTGGDGTDVASYAERTTPVDLSLDGAADDGAPGEGDRIDAEGAQGGGGNDVLTGGGGADRLDGGPGADRLTGMAGADALLGGAGDDTVEARDGVADSVDCGDGADGGAADMEDALAACEAVARPVVVIDADRDGVPAGLDCDDNDARRKTGGIEIPGNKLDEDCRGGAAPFPVIGAALALSFETRGNLTRFTEARVRSVPAGARVRLSCDAPKGARCPFKRFDKTFPRARRTVDVLARLKGRRFAKGFAIELRVTHPRAIGKALRFTTRAGGRAPRKASLCIAPGKKAKRCT